MSPSSQELEDELDLNELERIIQAVENDEPEPEPSSSDNSKHNESNNGEPSFESIQLQKLLESAIALDEEAKKNNTTNNENFLLVKNDENLKNDNFETLNKEIYDTNVNDIDSSDDEEVKNFLERKYNEYGQDINKRLKQKEEEIKDRKVINEVKNYCRGGFSSALINSLSQDSNKDKDRLSSSFKTPSNSSEGSSSDAKIKLDESKNTKSLIERENSSVYTDPVFGIRIVNPLISSSVLIERMSGRKAVGMCSLSFHTQRGDLSADWVVAGVIATKSPVKTAKNGSSYSIWRITDLKGDIKFASVFLFKSAHKELWKTSVGTVVAILNPGIFDKDNQKGDVACLSIDQASKVMIIGQSKDLGTCKAKKKNGDNCGVMVNLGECDFCLFHVQQEFGRMSKRSELQSATAGRGLNALRNKVLGKNEVFYGGQSFAAVPARKSAKQEAKDQKRLMTLTEYFQSPKSSNSTSSNDGNKSKLFSMKKEVPYNTASSSKQPKIANSVENNVKQRVKDLERLKALKDDAKNEFDDQKSRDTKAKNEFDDQKSRDTKAKNEFDDQKSKDTTTTISEKFRNREFSFSLQKAPTLRKDNFSFEVNLSTKKADLAKLKALEIIKQKPIEKSNPNFIKYRGTTTGKRRAIEELIEHDAKKVKLNEAEAKEQEQELVRKSRIQRIMDATSSHIDLIKSRENDQLDKYFYKMEKKESLEEKMLKTYKVPCKAVICMKCKYTAFSAADHCKEEKHTLKVIDAEKRFFQCQECGNRTVTVYKIPKLSCKNCQSSKWKRTSMIREKKIDNPSMNLSVRGDEEKFLGTLKSSATLNLLVPEENI